MSIISQNSSLGIFPKFSLLDQSHTPRTNPVDLHMLVLFYLRDEAPGCRPYIKAISSMIEGLKRLDCVAYGISNDSPRSHANFIGNHRLKIDLLSDPESCLFKELDLQKQSRMFGLDYLSNMRALFLIEKGSRIVAKIIDTTDITDIDAVINQLDQMQSSNQKDPSSWMHRV